MEVEQSPVSSLDNAVAGRPPIAPANYIEAEIYQDNAGFLGYFQAEGKDFNSRTSNLEKRLQSMKDTESKQSVVLKISISGIKILDEEGKVLSAHAMRRISYAHCVYEQCLFCFLARMPHSHTSDQYCFVFRLATPEQTDEVNTHVASVFQKAFERQQELQKSFSTKINEQLEQRIKQKKEQENAKKVDMETRFRKISESGVEERLLERRRRSESSSPPDEAPKSTAVDARQWARKAVMQSKHTNPVVERRARRCSPQHVADRRSLGVLADLSMEERAQMTKAISRQSLPGEDTVSSNISSFSIFPSRPRGSPVIALKESIDQHFAESNSRYGTHTAASARLHSAEFENMHISNSPSPQPQPSQNLHNNGDPHNSGNHNNGAVRKTNSSPKPVCHSPKVSPKVNEAIARTVKIENSEIEDLRHEPWYQPSIPRNVALEKLEVQGVGSFLVRDSSSMAGCYALSVRVPRYDSNPDGIAHYLIERTSTGVKLKGLEKEWPNLKSLIVHHTVMPEMLPCVLKLPRIARNPSFREIDRDDVFACKDEDYEKLTNFSSNDAELNQT